MKVHNLKCWPQYMPALWSGEKKFEVRVNDRDFQVGDELYLHEWNPETKLHTGRGARFKITYMVQGAPFLPDNLCVMSLGRTDAELDAERESFLRAQHAELTSLLDGVKDHPLMAPQYRHKIEEIEAELTRPIQTQFYEDRDGWKVSKL